VHRSHLGTRFATCRQPQPPVQPDAQITQVGVQRTRCRRALQAAPNGGSRSVTLRCRGDYQSAAAATVLMAGQLTSNGDPLPAGVLVPEEVLTIGELKPGLTETGITVVEEPERGAVSRAGSSGRWQGAGPRAAAA
jgi:hypothetical protein